ncbi:MAG: hypothetical protein M3518_10935 [Actinomycetota bacterium]|nr:hypothetical protein [Actinomycetota bacterium]
MVHEDKPVNRKRLRNRTALMLILALGGLASLLVGLQWEAALRGFATDLARIENFFNLINPNHISLAHSIVAGIVGLGHFLLVFGAAATLIGLSGVAYTYLRFMGNSRWNSPSFLRAFVFGTGAVVLLAAGAATWTTSAVSYEDELAAEPSGRASSPAGEKEDHAHCTEPPTPQQQEAADKLAADTKAGVAKYLDPSVAEAEGYQPSSPSWRPVTHYLNPAYQGDGEILDPSRPESLVYANTPTGPVLLGAMYLMPEPGAPGPTIGACLTQWHPHSLGGWVTPEMMHVWTADVPGGPFSELRPREFVQSLEDSS